MDTNTILIVVGFWIICGIASLLITQSKGATGSHGFLLGLLLGPIGVVLALMGSSKPADPVVFAPTSTTAAAEPQRLPAAVWAFGVFLLGALVLAVVLYVR